MAGIGTPLSAPIAPSGRCILPSPYPSGEGIVEDFNNAEAVNQYLLPYLQNAGADAWTVRERDMNTQMLIVDDGNAGFSTQGAWANNSGGYNGTYRSATTVNATANATATWTFTPLVTATYAVYVHFPNAAITRTVDAHFFVDHAGAITPITITQARDGNNWRFIGNYPFYGGQPARILLEQSISHTRRYGFGRCRAHRRRHGRYLSTRYIDHQRQAALGRTVVDVRQVGRLARCRNLQRCDRTSHLFRMGKRSRRRCSLHLVAH